MLSTLIFWQKYGNDLFCMPIDQDPTIWSTSNIWLWPNNLKMANKISGQGTTRCTETPRPAGRSYITKILAKFGDIPVSGVARHVSHSNAAIPIGLSPRPFLLSVWLQFLISFSIPPPQQQTAHRERHSFPFPFPISSFLWPTYVPDSSLHLRRRFIFIFACMYVGFCPFNFSLWNFCSTLCY